MWTGPKGPLRTALDGVALGSATAGVDLFTYGGLTGNPGAALAGAGLSEMADKVTNVKSVVFALDTCFGEGWSTAACGDAGSSSLQSVGADILFTGLPAGTLVDVFTGGNTVANEIWSWGPW